MFEGKIGSENLFGLKASIKIVMASSILWYDLVKPHEHCELAVINPIRNPFFCLWLLLWNVCSVHTIFIRVVGFCIRLFPPYKFKALFTFVNKECISFVLCYSWNSWIITNAVSEILSHSLLFGCTFSLPRFCCWLIQWIFFVCHVLFDL